MKKKEEGDGVKNEGTKEKRSGSGGGGRGEGGGVKKEETKKRGEVERRMNGEG